MSRKVLDRIAIGVLLPALAVAAWLLLPQVRGAMDYLTGKSHGCSFQGAMGAYDVAARYADTLQLMEKRSRVVQREGDLRLTDTPMGQWWEPDADGDALLSVLAEQGHGIYGQVRRGDVVLDCGAHVGAFSRHALDSGAKLVVAIEPSPVTARALRRNLAQEIESGRVIVVEKGVWERTGTLLFRKSSRTSAADRVIFGGENAQPGDIEVAVTSIDDLVAELNLPRVDMIKMDIEGSEKWALLGGSATIRQFHPRLALAMYHRADDLAVLPMTVHAIAAGYTQSCGECMASENGVGIQTALFR